MHIRRHGRQATFLTRDAFAGNIHEKGFTIPKTMSKYKNCKI